MEATHSWRSRHAIASRWSERCVRSRRNCSCSCSSAVVRGAPRSAATQPCSCICWKLICSSVCGGKHETSFAVVDHEVRQMRTCLTHSRCHATGMSSSPGRSPTCGPRMLEAEPARIGCCPRRGGSASGGARLSARCTSWSCSRRTDGPEPSGPCLLRESCLDPPNPEPHGV